MPCQIWYHFTAREKFVMAKDGDVAKIAATDDRAQSGASQAQERLAQDAGSMKLGAHRMQNTDCRTASSQPQQASVVDDLVHYAQRLAERAILSEKLDGAADLASNIWHKISGTIYGDDENSKFVISGKRAILPQTERQKPEGICQGAADSSDQMEVSLYVKSKATDLALNREVQRIQQGIDDFLSEAEFTKRFGADPEAIGEVTKFARDNRLSIKEIDLRSGKIVLAGNVGQFNHAFGTELKCYEQSDGSTVRARENALSVPKGLAPHIDAVLGLDDRPQAHTNFIKLTDLGGSTALEPHAAAGSGPRPMMPTEVAALYHFPDNTTGKGQGIAIIELGGNPDPRDYEAYYKAHGMKVPKINIISVDGARTSPGTSTPANGELALDAEVIGAVAPDAVQNMIMAPNSDKGFVDAIERAAFPKAGETQNQAISISWGQKESSWTQQGFREMDAIFKKAYIRGIGVYAASGDDGAKDRAWLTYQADYPASDPYVTGTGGTRLIGEDGKIVSETVWNNGKHKGAGGGGISHQWGVPDYQKGIKLPPNANFFELHTQGRGVPDVAGNADPRSGYIVQVDGKEMAVGGTSAVAPLYAALHARLGEAVGNGRPTMIGNLNPFFYRHGLEGGFFRDITEGNNSGYNAGPGWDATTGWGSISDGNRLLAALKADLAAQRQLADLPPKQPAPEVLATMPKQPAPPGTTKPAEQKKPALATIG